MPTATAMQLSFPDLFEDADADDTIEHFDGSRLKVQPMAARQAREICERWHYMHRKPATSFAYGLYRAGEPVGVVTFGTPASRHLQMGACPEDPSLVIELNRLWVAEVMPKNTESWFVSRAIRALPPKIIVSYADTTWGHMGYVYRALNFRYAGWTDMERRTPRLDYIPMAPNAHTKGAASRSGIREKVRRKPKVKYWITSGNRTERAELVARMQWPSLDWRELPPPTEHRYHPLPKTR